jgi:tetratricopeptide (TPR) repeat protein
MLLDRNQTAPGKRPRQPLLAWASYGLWRSIGWSGALRDDGAVQVSRIRQLGPWWIFAAVFVLGLVSLVVWLQALTTDQLSAVGQIASAVSGYTALASFVISVFPLIIAIRQNKPSTADAERELTGRVKDQWAEEAVLRQALPVPLQVRWSSTGRPVAAGRDVVLDELPGADWQQLPLEGDVEAIVAAFRDLPHRQLVVLGEPGAGKSVLAMLLTLRLIEDPEARQPVPVLLPIASWNPTVELPQEFVARRLGEEYEFLAERGAHGRSVAELLVAQGRVLPVLDGLDELPTEWHCRALEALYRFSAAGRPLIVACRSQEYEQAVIRSGVVLSRAAVVEIDPIDAVQAIAFLSVPAPGRSRWQPVFEHLRQHPHGPLAQALSTPLMVVLASTTYRSPTTDPSVLLEFRDKASVVRVLIDRFVTSVYQADHPEPRAVARAQRLRSYEPGRAGRWLSCLAYHLYQAGTPDLWWWQLSPGLLAARPKRVQRLVPILTVLIVAIAVGVVTGMVVGIWPAVRAAAVAFGVVAVSASGVFRSLWPGGYPPYVVLKYRSRRWRRIWATGLRMAFGVMFGLMASLLISMPLLGLVGGLLCGFVAVVSPAWSVPIRARRSSPRLTLLANYRNAVAAAAQHGLTGGGIFAAAAFTFGSSDVLIVGCTAGLVYAVSAAYCAGLWTWTRFRLAHLQLAMRGWLPLRLWTFLDDAHRRGMLRQAGTTWQFRHALLQDHLARDVHREHLRARADAGDRNAGRRLVDVLAEQGRLDQLRARADAGDWHAGRRLVDVLAEQGRLEEAIAILQVHADAGDWDASSRLADVLAKQGRLDQLRARADAGDWHAGRRLVDVLAEQGRLEEAIAILQAHADAGDRDASSRLADVLAQQGRLDQLRARAEARDWHARRRLVDVLAEQGRLEEAIAILQAHADAGDRDAGRRLVDVLAEQGRFDELRARADAGDQDAESRLIDVRAVQSNANTSDRGVAMRLADVLAKQGRFDKAIAILQVHADAGDWGATRRLADVLAKQGRFDEANAMLEVRANAGERDAARRLLDVLVWRKPRR